MFRMTVQTTTAPQLGKSKGKIPGAMRAYGRFVLHSELRKDFPKDKVLELGLEGGE